MAPYYGPEPFLYLRRQAGVRRPGDPLPLGLGQGVGVPSAFGATIAKIRAGAADPDILVISDSLGNSNNEWVYRFFAEVLPTLHPTHSVVYHLWNDGVFAGQTGSYDAPVTLYTGTGPRTVHVWNFAVSGAPASYGVGVKFDAAIAATDADLVIWNHGHNHYQDIRPLWSYQTGVENVRLGLPNASHAMFYENPRRDDDLMNAVYADQDLLMSSYGDITRIEARQKFIDRGKAADLYESDGIHVSVVGAPSGTDLFIEAFRETWVAAGSGLAVTPAFLSGVDTNQIANGLFGAFDGAVPDSWTLAGTGAAAAKELSIVDAGRPYSVRISGTGAGSRLQQAIPTVPIRGRKVSLAVRMLIPEGTATGRGRIAVQTTGTGAVVYSSKALGNMWDGRWFWQVMPDLLIPESPTGVNVFLYADTSANTDSVIYVDRAVLVIGDKPRNAA